MFTSSHFFLQILSAFAPLFRSKVFERVGTLLRGAILAPAKRTVTAALRASGREHEKDFTNFHRLLNRVNWSPLAASRILLGLVLEAFLPQGPLVVAIDDTIERRKGAKIKAIGVQRDPTRSHKGHVVKVTGLRWLCAMAVVWIPWAKKFWALPLMSMLCPSSGYYEKQGREHKNMLEHARVMIGLLRRWTPRQRQIVVVADSTFASIGWLQSVAGYASIITRLRLDAALYDSPPARAPGQRGRPPKAGQRQPKLQQRLQDPDAQWQEYEVQDWYGQGKRLVQLLTGTALWWTRGSGRGLIPVRWVLVRDPQGSFQSQALLCTQVDLCPEQILKWFVMRWPIEVTFEQAREHLGMESQRQWSDKAIARTTPIILGLYSLVTLLAHKILEQSPEKMHLRTSAWYPKTTPTFSDTLALVRQELWHEETIKSRSTPHPDLLKIPRAIFTRLTEALSYQ